MLAPSHFFDPPAVISWTQPHASLIVVTGEIRKFLDGSVQRRHLCQLFWAIKVVNHFAEFSTTIGLIECALAKAGDIVEFRNIGTWEDVLENFAQIVEPVEKNLLINPATRTSLASNCSSRRIRLTSTQIVFLTQRIGHDNGRR